MSVIERIISDEQMLTDQRILAEAARLLKVAEVARSKLAPFLNERTAPELATFIEEHHAYRDIALEVLGLADGLL